MKKPDREFYTHILKIALPIMLQNGVTNFVNMLDNIMVGRIGTDSMSGVAIIGQLILVWNLCLFGATSGAGIFTAQFTGKGDEKGVRYTFRLQLILAAVLLAAGLAVFILFQEPLISLFLHQDEGIGNAAQTLAFARRYLNIMLIGFFPFTLTQVYASVLKSSGETAAPMRASLAAVVINLIGNYILIFGKFGAPALGVAGAAAATVISRFAELALIVLHTHLNAGKYPFIRGAWSSLSLPPRLAVSYLSKGFPLLVNELIWSGGQTALIRNYSLRGLSVVAALNISMTISNFFNVAFLAMGLSTGIIIGQELGMRHFDTVKATARKLTRFTLLLCFISGAVLFAFSKYFPLIYNTSDEIRGLACGFIRITAACMWLYGYSNSAYFISRSGGKTLLTALFDSGSVWLIAIPLSYVLAAHTGLPILTVYLLVQAADVIKAVIAFILIRSGIWINDIVADIKT